MFQALIAQHDQADAVKEELTAVQFQFQVIILDILFKNEIENSLLDFLSAFICFFPFILTATLCYW